MPLKTLIVDDEPIARAVLREELESMKGVEVIGEADNGVIAVDAITRRNPDLVLLDLQMPGMSGLEVVRTIRHGVHMPAFVIVTAYNDYALQAFDAGAIDYLIKPVRRERLVEAVERAKNLSGWQSAEKLAQLQETLDIPNASRPRRIVGKVDAEYFLLNSDEILGLQAEGAIVWIITTRKKYVATMTLKALEARLASSGFERIHRGALVNVNHVRKMSVLSSQRWLITLSNNQEFVASKRLAGRIRSLLKV